MTPPLPTDPATPHRGSHEPGGPFLASTGSRTPKLRALNLPRPRTEPHETSSLTLAGSGERRVGLVPALRSAVLVALIVAALAYLTGAVLGMRGRLERLELEVSRRVLCPYPPD